MKRILLIILSVFIIASGTVFSAADNNLQKQKGGNLMNKKILIAYFSWSGNTKHIAELIQKETDGDMFRIETKVAYPENYNETAYGIAKEQHDKNIHPELKNNGDVSGYDVIFVGTPAWWYTMAPAVMTFLENNNFEGKTVVPFITHGGGGKYNIAEEISKFAEGSKVSVPLVVYGKGNADTQKEISEWISKIKP